MRSHTTVYDRYVPLLIELAELVDRPGDAPRRVELIAELVAAFTPLARNIAARYTRRGEPLEDLEQVAAVGLLHALRRYDPTRGHHFLAYAIPTITGEIRRHFRDTTWAVRTPRDLRDRYVAIGGATAVLSDRLGRAPSAGELADHLDLDRDQVIEALEASYRCRPVPLDRALSATTDLTPVDVLGAEDPDLEQVERRAELRGLVATLPERERHILVLRFVHDQTQTQIAARLGISQMHVSRLLDRTLRRLRDRAGTDTSGSVGSILSAPACGAGSRRSAGGRPP